MTITEAKLILGLREDDTVFHRRALDEIQQGLKERLNLWSVPNYEKENIRKELEAIRTLKGEIK